MPSQLRVHIAQLALVLATRLRAITRNCNFSVLQHSFVPRARRTATASSRASGRTWLLVYVLISLPLQCAMLAFVIARVTHKLKVWRARFGYPQRFQIGDAFVEEHHPELAAMMYEKAACVKAFLEQQFDIVVTFAGLTIHRKRGGSSCSIDLLATVGCDYCWLELKWTRKSLDTPGSVDLAANEKIKLFSRIQGRLSAWVRDDKQGGGPVFPAQRLGKLVVRPTGFALAWQHGETVRYNFENEDSANKGQRVRIRPNSWDAFNEQEKKTGNARKKAYKRTERGEESVAASIATRHNFDANRVHRTRSRVALEGLDKAGNLPPEVSRVPR